QIADGEGERGRGAVFVDDLVGDVRDGGQIVHGVDREQETGGGSAARAVVDDERDGGLAGLIRDRGDDEGTAGAVADDGDVAVGNQARVGGRRCDGQRIHAGFDVTDGEWN